MMETMSERNSVKLLHIRLRVTSAGIMGIQNSVFYARK
jgi:hypothetical protein